MSPSSQCAVLSALIVARRLNKQDAQLLPTTADIDRNERERALIAEAITNVEADILRDKLESVK